MKKNTAPKPKPSNEYYVYTLAYPDGRVFYVGKGTKNRIGMHESEARQRRGTIKRPTCYCQKCMIIRSIWRKNKEVLRSIVLKTSDEALAFDYERALIVQHSDGDLCNKSIRIPKSDMQTLEIKNALLSDDDRSKTGRRRQGAASVYQIKSGRWCASVSQVVPGKGRMRKKFESVTREGAVSKLAAFLSKHKDEGWVNSSPGYTAGYVNP